MDNSEAKHEEARHPIGFRFMPTDEEIILYYLRKHPCEFDLAKAVHSVDVYDYDPWTLQSMYGMERVKETYFISYRNKKYPGGYRPARAAGDGYWKATGTDHKVKNEYGEELGGVRKTLVYYIKNKEEGGKPVKTNWIMQEYRLGEPGEVGLKKAKNPGFTRLDGQVLCKIYQKIYARKEAEQEMELGLLQQEEVQVRDEQMELGFYTDGMVSSINGDQALSVGFSDIFNEDLYSNISPISSFPPLSQYGEQHATDHASDVHMFQEEVQVRDEQMELGFYSDGMVSSINSDQALSVGFSDIFNEDLYSTITPISSFPPLSHYGEQHATDHASDVHMFQGLYNIDSR